MVDRVKPVGCGLIYLGGRLNVSRFCVINVATVSASSTEYSEIRSQSSGITNGFQVPPRGMAAAVPASHGGDSHELETHPSLCA